MLQFEQLIETMFGLAADGKTNPKGMPNPLRLAVIARHFDDVRLPFPPVWMQRMGLALGAPVGRVLGYQATYVPVGVDSAQPVTESAQRMQQQAQDAPPPGRALPRAASDRGGRLGGSAVQRAGHVERRARPGAFLTGGAAFLRLSISEGGLAQSERAVLAPRRSRPVPEQPN